MPEIAGFEGKGYAVFDGNTLIALCPDGKVAENVKEDYNRRHKIIVVGADDQLVRDELAGKRVNGRRII